MFHKTFFLFILLSSISVLSQTELLIAKAGIITKSDNQKIQFNNLRLINKEFHFISIVNGVNTVVSTNSVKYIEDDKSSRVFSNKKVIDSTETIDLKKIETQKQLDIEKFAKQRQESKRLLEALDTIKPFNKYPSGIYKTKEDFIKQIPSSKVRIIAKELSGFEKETIDYISDNCFFYEYDSDEKIKNVFAISFKGHLYFQINGILKNRNEDDGAQSNEQPNSFVRVLIGGGNYYYTEATLANQWAQALSYNMGAVGMAMAASNRNSKGVVWDIKTKEFNIFRNCKDYNEFMSLKYPEGILNCKNQQLNLQEIRKAIEKIK